MTAVTLKQLKQALTQQNKDIGARLAQQTKDIFIDVSNHIDEAVLPQIDKLSKRVNNIENNMATKDDIDRIERKLVKKDDRLDRYGARIDNHERRISNLETKTGMPS